MPLPTPEFTATDNRHIFTFKEWAITVWAKRHAIADVFIFAFYAKFTPFCPVATMIERVAKLSPVFSVIW